MKDDIKRAVEVLSSGGIILYPTDTIWGIGCDATNKDAVSRIYSLKQREDNKSMLVLVHSEGMIPSYVEQVPEIAWELLDASTEPMTLIYPSAKNLAENLVASDGSIGIRVTGDPFCRKLIEKFRKPIVSTSANISGNPSPALFDEIDPGIVEAVDFAVHWRRDDLQRGNPSAVIKIGTGGVFEILRK